MGKLEKNYALFEAEELIWCHANRFLPTQHNAAGTSQDGGQCTYVSADTESRTTINFEVIN